MNYISQAIKVVDILESHSFSRKDAIRYVEITGQSKISEPDSKEISDIFQRNGFEKEDAEMVATFTKQKINGY